VIGLASEPEEHAVKQDGRDDERLIFEDFFFVNVCVAWMMCDMDHRYIYMVGGLENQQNGILRRHG